MNQIPKASTWARTIPKYGLRLAQLDLYVLKQHDGILSALGYERVPDGKISRWGRYSWVDIFWVVVMFAPLAGVTVTGDRVFNPNTRTYDDLDSFSDGFQVAAAMWCFIVALPGPAIAAYRWWRSQRHWFAHELVYLAFAVVFSGLALATLANDKGVAIFTAVSPSTPVWLTGVSAAIVLLTLAVASQGRRVDVPVHFRAVGRPDLPRAGELVAELEPREHDRVHKRRARALTMLRERGLVDESQAKHVESTPLGMSVTVDS